eukprot:TRINITY_DN16958_c0_g1_i1.p1 TRINITY_DN16958_c0_g1~~TRINITY_DN16958_c0_g1_i1.p1  ORF type:complete len:282 (+),score=13.71 TRINITY_DN16958_c0_g1_i1:114-959(+)
MEILGNLIRGVTDFPGNSIRTWQNFSQDVSRKWSSAIEDARLKGEQISSRDRPAPTGKKKVVRRVRRVRTPDGRPDARMAGIPAKGAESGATGRRRSDDGAAIAGLMSRKDEPRVMERESGGASFSGRATEVSDGATESVSADIAAAICAQPNFGGDGEGPPTREALGRATWTFLHTLAAQYPDHPTRQQQRDVKELMTLMTRIYPCRECAEHFKGVLREHPPVASSGVELSQWMCEAHNVVNRRLQKPQFPCTRVDARWGALDCDSACTMEGRSVPSDYY